MECSEGGACPDAEWCQQGGPCETAKKYESPDRRLRCGAGVVSVVRWIDDHPITTGLLLAIVLFVVLAVAGVL